MHFIKGSRITIIALFAGTIMVGMLKYLYPQTEVSEYLTIVIILALLIAALFELCWKRWTTKGGNNEQA